MEKKVSTTFVAALVLIISIVSYKTTESAPLKDNQVPQPLSEWKSWVLYDMEDKLCPTNYNNEQAYRCRWPSRLKLSINATGGGFEQEWSVFAETWAPLPGGTDTWPGNVMDGNIRIPVISRGKTPSVLLKPGKHLIKGGFVWSDMPEMIIVPSETGIVNLTINGKTVNFPVIDNAGRLWLQKRVSSEEQENTQSLTIFRLLDDAIPMTVTNHFQINISGQAREIRFESVLLKDSIPMEMDSPLPARIGDNGVLMIQARPGRWEIDITTRFIDPINQLGPIPCNYGQEIWSFAPQNHLRMVEVEGVPSTEPGRTNMPSEWKTYSAFIIDPGASITFKLLRRGDPDPAPDRLTLQKTMWLDFNGKGFTIQDRIYGTITRTWRLTMNPPINLGRAVIDGEAQLITADEKTGKSGVELRKGRLNMTADSRYTESIYRIPAVGWDHNLNAMSGMLNLPPGWRLFAASGIDKAPGTWALRWSLLDFFLVLIIAAAVCKLRGWRWGIVALITMVLIYHEVGAPKTIWLHILAAIALIPILPDGRVKRLVYMWGGIAGIILIIMSIPFMVTQIRCGLFPQLELRGRQYQQVWERDKAAQVEMYDTDSLTVTSARPRISMEAEPQEMALEEKTLAPQKRYAGALRSRTGDMWQEGGKFAQKQAIHAQDPNALIQTGPGLPSWQWKSIPMTWNGPVNKDHQIRLWLISPSVNMVLAFIRVILLAVMIIGIVNLSAIWRKMKTNLGTTAIALVLILSTGIAKADSGSGLFPPQELLKEYQGRLLEKADCYPFCADCLKIDVNIQPKQLRIMMEIHTAVKTAVPLPGSQKSWVPDQVLMDKVPVQALSRDKNGLLWTLVPGGIHKIVMIGKTGPGNSMQIPLPLKPHSATYNSNGWDVQGIHADGNVESGIQLTRLKKEEKDTALSTHVSLPPFLHVERVISLGLTWEITTTVTRLTPVGTPIVISVPLVHGESVTTAGIRVEDGKALVNIDPSTSRFWWNSSLDNADSISLKAPESMPWTETWVLDASPIWHCESSGIPVVHHQDEQGQWRPTWQPWPGEAISIKVTRPKAVPGETMTIDSTHLTMTPGLRSHLSQLIMTIRASKGGQHQITLPEDADLQLVKINNKTQPIRQEGRKIVIPIQPGEQTIFLEWNSQSLSSMFIKGPAVIVGKQAVNALVTFKTPPDRWILWTHGPTLGPAVLYWSYVIVILLIATGLGQVKITPLKTHHWIILGLGLTQIPIQMALIIAAWFIILGLRKKYPKSGHAVYFNLLQMGICLWTIITFACLYSAVSHGLLGIPDMQISGNGSIATQLNWTQDRINDMMPQPWVVSLPKIAYNVLILIWALWLVLFLIKWLKWGWGCFVEDGIWKKIQRKSKTASTPGVIENGP